MIENQSLINVSSNRNFKWSKKVIKKNWRIFFFINTLSHLHFRPLYYINILSLYGGIAIKYCVCHWDFETTKKQFFNSTILLCHYPIHSRAREINNQVCELFVSLILLGLVFGEMVLIVVLPYLLNFDY